MNNKETAALIREWVNEDKACNKSLFSWPTDGAGYDQHILFVEHRNKFWVSGTSGEWWQFCLDYADRIETL
jgi:hypothetical protein